MGGKWVRALCRGPLVTAASATPQHLRQGMFSNRISPIFYIYETRCFAHAPKINEKRDGKTRAWSDSRDPPFLLEKGSPFSKWMKNHSVCPCFLGGLSLYVMSKTGFMTHSVPTYWNISPILSLEYFRRFRAHKHKIIRQNRQGHKTTRKLECFVGAYIGKP